MFVTSKGKVHQRHQSLLTGLDSTTARVSKDVKTFYGSRGSRAKTVELDQMTYLAQKPKLV